MVYSYSVDQNPQRVPFQLTGHQRKLQVSLAQRNQTLGDLYEAACRVYADELLPSRLALAAHALRELTGGLPVALDLPIPVNPAYITEQVDILEPFWMRALSSGCHQNGEWIGTIDLPVRSLLKQVHRLFEWLRVNRPKRREVAREMFRKMDPYGLQLPEELVDLRYKTWKDLVRYFNNTAHGEPTTVQEFGTNLEALERLLIDNLSRTPSVDLSVIDSILAEESGDA